MFDKDRSRFPVKEQTIYLNHCGVSPLFLGSLEREQAFSEHFCREGFAAFAHYPGILQRFHRAAAKLLRANPENISFVNSTAEGLNLIANGYPIEQGDQIVSYVHEYPSNHYPWKLQQRRGAELVLLSDHDPLGSLPKERPRAWSLEELEASVTERTKIIALSHVQFTSGYAADLRELGAFASSRGIDLIVDAAQSLGSLAVYPEQWGVSALAASGWKWLLGPIGSAILFTTPEFREKIADTMVGSDTMKQGEDYLDHSWNPHSDGRRFEYSTLPLALTEGLTTVIEDLFVHYGIENIEQEIFRLQDQMISLIDCNRFTPVIFPSRNRSGILSLITKENPENLAVSLRKKGVFCTSRGGYLRLAPHFYISDEEIVKAMEILNTTQA